MNPLELLVLAAASRIPDGKHPSSSMSAASASPVGDPDRGPRILVARGTP